MANLDRFAAVLALSRDSASERRNPDPEAEGEADKCVEDPWRKTPPRRFRLCIPFLPRAITTETWDEEECDGIITRLRHLVSLIKTVDEKLP